MEAPVSAVDALCNLSKNAFGLSSARRRDIWSSILHYAMPDGHNLPASYAGARSRVALVDKTWMNRVYSDPSLWSTLHINQDITSEQLAFALAKTGSADLRIRIAFIDFRISSDTPYIDEMETVADLVDRVFDVIAPTCARWTSFYCYTENPELILAVRNRCSSLVVPKLRSLAVGYLRRPGYSEFTATSNIYNAPLATHIWFNGTFAPLHHLELHSLYVPFTHLDILCSIVSLDLTQLPDLDWHALVAIFSAPRLRFLKLTAVSTWHTILGPPLYSASLQVLDLGFQRQLFLVQLLFALTAPSLDDLTLRDVGPHMRRISRAPLMSQITRFAVTGEFTGHDHPVFVRSVAMLFDAMPNLRVLALHHCAPCVFVAYCAWRYARVANHAVRGAALETLYLGRINVVDVLEFVVHCGAEERSAGYGMTLRSIYMRPDYQSFDREVLGWIKDHIGIFSFIFNVLDQLCVTDVTWSPTLLLMLRSWLSRLVSFRALSVLNGTFSYVRSRFFGGSLKSTSLALSLLWKAHLLRSQLLPQTVAINLDVDYDTLDDITLASRMRAAHRLSVRDCLALVAGSSFRWVAPSICVVDNELLGLVVDAVQSMHVPMLDQLDLCCMAYGPSFDRLASYLRSGPTPFLSSTPSLTQLRLTSSSLPWETSSYYRGLTRLEVLHVPANLAPTIAQFVDILSSASSLHRLALSGTGFSDVALPVGTVLVDMPSLLDLDLRYPEHAVPSFARSPPYPRFCPKLRRLRLWSNDFNCIGLFLRARIGMDLETVQIPRLIGSVIVIARPQEFYTCGLLQLCTDVLELVVFGTLPDYFSDPVAFLRQRTRIMQTCRTLYFVVLDSARMWTSYCLSPGLPTSELDIAALRFEARVLNLHVEFNTDHESPPKPGRASVSDTLEFIKTHSGQCRSLRLSLDAVSFLDELVLDVRAMSWDRLTSFTFLQLDAGHFSGAAFPEAIQFPVAGSFNTSVTVLRLFNTFIHWNSLPSFTVLSILVLHLDFWCMSPFADNLAAILRNNPGLTRLSLQLHVVPTAGNVALAPVALPQLSELNIAVTCAMPALAVLGMDFSRPGDLAVFSAVTCSSPGISVFRPSGVLFTPDAEWTVLRGLPALRTLNLWAMAGSTFHRALSGDPDRRGRAPTCPSLSVLSVSGYEARTLRDMVERRKVWDMVIDDIYCRRVYPANEAPYMADITVGTNLLFGPDFAGPGGAVYSSCVDADGSPIFVRIVGVVHDIEHDQNGNIVRLVLRYPESRFPTCRGIYSAQSAALVEALRPLYSTAAVRLYWLCFQMDSQTDFVGQSAPLWDLRVGIHHRIRGRRCEHCNTLLWWCRIRIFLLIGLQLDVNTLDISSADLITLGLIMDSPRMSAPPPDPISRGALVLCLAEPYRVDVPVESGRYDRVCCVFL
ncbi:hypothetical protein C8R46DRAFT_1032728 [Mycena filopes]|nr:hypothetical protein C8R46DRAFT_1032728 [Mycena filopes]